MKSRIVLLAAAALFALTSISAFAQSNGQATATADANPGGCDDQYVGGVDNVNAHARALEAAGLDVAIDAANALRLPVVAFLGVVPFYPNANRRHYQLLAEGQIDEAEAYMEQRRQLFWENGYGIRKLNQAYFAFHGAYADVPLGPAGEDPVGAAVRALRAQSPSLAHFLNQMARMTSFEQLKQAIEAAG